MSGTFVDTNVLLDLATNDPKWSDWSIRELDAAALRGPLLINDIIYAEFSAGFTAVETVDAFLDEGGLIQCAMPRAALFLAAKAFQQYRSAGGVRTGVLPDFFIGAHAAIEGLPLLTRDAGRFRSYFPKLALRTP